jgi:hypothetical protein
MLSFTPPGPDSGALTERMRASGVSSTIFIDARDSRMLPLRRPETMHVGQALTAHKTEPSSGSATCCRVSKSSLGGRSCCHGGQSGMVGSTSWV